MISQMKIKTAIRYHAHLKNGYCSKDIREKCWCGFEKREPFFTVV
jgi:hypothetical protein